MLEKNIEKVLLTKEQLEQRIKELGAEITRDYQGKELVLAAVLILFTNFVKPTKKWHPIIFIGISAVVGIVFHFGGV